MRHHATHVPAGEASTVMAVGKLVALRRINDYFQ
jgi:hypothetical protein